MENNNVEELLMQIKEGKFFHFPLRIDESFSNKEDNDNTYGGWLTNIFFEEIKETKDTPKYFLIKPKGGNIKAYYLPYNPSALAEINVRRIPTDGTMVITDGMNGCGIGISLDKKDGSIYLMHDGNCDQKSREENNYKSFFEKQGIKGYNPDDSYRLLIKSEDYLKGEVYKNIPIEYAGRNMPIPVTTLIMVYKEETDTWYAHKYTWLRFTDAKNQVSFKLMNDIKCKPQNGFIKSIPMKSLWN